MCDVIFPRSGSEADIATYYFFAIYRAADHTERLQPAVAIQRTKFPATETVAFRHLYTKHFKRTNVAPFGIRRLPHFHRSDYRESHQCESVITRTMDHENPQTTLRVTEHQRAYKAWYGTVRSNRLSPFLIRHI